MKDILTVTRISLKGEEPKLLKENILFIISKQVMLDYRSRNIPLSIPSNRFAENSKSLECQEEKTKYEFSENEITIDIDENDDLDSMLMDFRGLPTNHS